MSLGIQGLSQKASRFQVPEGEPKIPARSARGSKAATATTLTRVRIPAEAGIRLGLDPGRVLRAESRGGPSSRPPSSLAGATWLVGSGTRPGKRGRGSNSGLCTSCLIGLLTTFTITNDQSLTLLGMLTELSTIGSIENSSSLFLTCEILFISKLRICVEKKTSEGTDCSTKDNL